MTPEAVRLQFEDAGIGSRAVAIAIDWAIQLTALLVGSLAAALLLPGATLGLPAWAGTTLLVLFSFVVLFGYPIGFETLTRGRTPGKMALGLRVVTVEGAPVGFRHAALRAALGLVDFAITSGFVAVITSLLSARGQRLGDHVAGTVVVRERTGAGRTTAATFTVPQGHDSYAATIDPTGLRPEDYQAVRAFLLRAPALPANRRAALGQRLAAGVATRISHRIPDEVHPEAFLQCVATRYQARGVPQRTATSVGMQEGTSGEAHVPQAPQPSAGHEGGSRRSGGDAVVEEAAEQGEQGSPHPQRTPRGGFSAPN